MRTVLGLEWVIWHARGGCSESNENTALAVAATKPIWILEDAESLCSSKPGKGCFSERIRDRKGNAGRRSVKAMYSTPVAELMWPSDLSSVLPRLP